MDDDRLRRLAREELTPDLDLLSRALALQGAYTTVLQRVLARVVAELDREAIGRIMADGAAQLRQESRKLAGTGYRDVLQDLLSRFDVLREELRQEGASEAPDSPVAGAGRDGPRSLG